MRHRLYLALLILPALLIVLAVMAWPLAVLTGLSFSTPEPGLQNYEWFFASGKNVTVLIRTFAISGWVTLVCLICAYPYAYLLTTVAPRTRLILLMGVMVPFWISGTVRTLAWVVILQDSGLINTALQSLGLSKVKLIRTQLGVTIGMAQVLMPFAILPLYSVMKSIDLRLVRAARSLGAGPVRAFAGVYLPLSMPGIVAAASLVFILSLGFYITPALLGGPRSVMLSSLAQTQVSTLLDWGKGGAIGVILLVVTFAVLALVAPFVRQRYRKGSRS